MKARTHFLASILILATATVAANAQSSRSHARRTAKAPRHASAPQKPAAPTASKSSTLTGVVTLMGAFGKPGDVAFAPGMTVRTAIIAAGGFTSEADASTVTLRRAGAASLAKIDGQAAMEGDLVQNAALKPGDVLVVMPKQQPAEQEAQQARAVQTADPKKPVAEQPASAQAQPSGPASAPPATPAAQANPPASSEPAREVVKIVGEIAHPGVYEYKPMSVQDVLKLVVLNKDAEKCKIVIYRGNPADPAQATKITYDANKVAKGEAEDIMLQPGDIIQVPKHKKYNLFNDIIGRLKPSKQVVEGISGLVKGIAPLAINSLAPGAGALGLLAK